MTPTRLRRRYAGRAPFEDLWFVEVAAGRDEGLWLRYVIVDGVDPRVELWASWFDQGGVKGHVERLPLAGLDTTNPVFGHGPHWLDGQRAVGASGSFAWDLQLTDGGPTHAHYPWTLARTGLARRLYVPAVLDLAVTGTVTVGGVAHRLDGARGVLGHIFGTRNATVAWTWAHASFAGGDLLELLGGQLRVGPVTLPTMASVVVHHGGHTWRFSRTRDLVRNEVRWTSDTVTVRAARGPATVEVRATLPPAHQVALVEYADPAGGLLYCRNSRLAPLTARLVDPSRGVDVDLATPSAAFELGSRERPPGEVLLR